MRQTTPAIPTVFGRNLKHSKGRDIVAVNHKDFWRKDFWVQVIPNIQAEWRITIFNGQSIARGLKEYDETTVQANSIVVRRGLPVRNRLTGWRMRHDIAPPEMVRETAKRAVKSLGYLYGAVDLAITTDNQVYVFEVNTGQGLDDYTLGQYVKAITKWGQDR